MTGPRLHNRISRVRESARQLSSPFIRHPTVESISRLPQARSWVIQLGDARMLCGVNPGEGLLKTKRSSL